MAINTQEPPPSRRTLSDLPPELKAIIARMAQDQDLPHRDRKKSMTSTVQELALLGESEWDGKSAQALSLVDRAWRSALVPVLFETITSTGCAEDVFGFRIVVQYGRFVKRVDFLRRNRAEDWQSLLRALPSFANLNHVTFTSDSLYSLFNTEGDPSAAQTTYREILQEVAPSISTLHLDYASPSAFAWTLARFHNVRRLEWPVYAGVDENDIHSPSFSLALHALSHSHRLEHLVLSSEVEPLLRALDERQGPPAWMRSLRKLELALEDGVQMSTWRFIQSVSDTLEQLILCLSDGPVKPSQAPLTAFPRLHRLTLEVRSPRNIDITPHLKLFATSPIHHLVLSVSGSGLGGPRVPTPALLETVLQLYPTHLRHINLNYPQYASIPQLYAIAPILTSLASARNISLTLGPAYDVFVIPYDFGTGVEFTRLEVIDKSHDDVHRVLEFGSVQAAALRARRDDVGMDKLIEALRPLKAIMMREKD